MPVAPLPKDTSSQTPSHVAVIMDGNGRWAQSRGLPRTMGHRKGADAVKAVIRAAIDAGVRYLTLYGFSSENWKRPTTEVSDLMGLLRLYLRNEIKQLHQNGVRFQVIGERDRLSPDIIDLIDHAERLTADNGTLILTLALSYGSRAELAAAARAVAEKVERGEIRAEDIDESLFERQLFTAGLPDPDILIRTSGEKRLSNFLLWQMAYTEFVFVDTLWPDFAEKDFLEAISEFHRRERRYGATSG